MASATPVKTGYGKPWIDSPAENKIRLQTSIQKMTKQEIPCSSEYLRGLLVSQALHKESFSLSNTVFQESRIPAVIHSSTH